MAEKKKTKKNKMLRGRIEAHPRPRRVLEEQVAHGSAAQGGDLRVGSSTDLGHVVGEVEQSEQSFGADVVDPAEMASWHHRLPPS